MPMLQSDDRLLALVVQAMGSEVNRRTPDVSTTVRSALLDIARHEPDRMEDADFCRALTVGYSIPEDVIPLMVEAAFNEGETRAVIMVSISSLLMNGDTDRAAQLVREYLLSARTRRVSDPVFMTHLQNILTLDTDNEAWVLVTNAFTYADRVDQAIQELAELSWEIVQHQRPPSDRVEREDTRPMEEITGDIISMITTNPALVGSEDFMDELMGTLQDPNLIMQILQEAQNDLTEARCNPLIVRYEAHYAVLDRNIDGYCEAYQYARFIGQNRRNARVSRLATEGIRVAQEGMDSLGQNEDLLNALTQSLVTPNPLLRDMVRVTEHIAEGHIPYIPLNPQPDEYAMRRSFIPGVIQHPDGHLTLGNTSGRDVQLSDRATVTATRAIVNPGSITNRVNNVGDMRHTDKGTLEVWAGNRWHECKFQFEDALTPVRLLMGGFDFEQIAEVIVVSHNGQGKHYTVEELFGLATPDTPEGQKFLKGLKDKADTESREAQLFEFYASRLGKYFVGEIKHVGMQYKHLAGQKIVFAVGLDEHYEKAVPVADRKTHDIRRFHLFAQFEHSKLPQALPGAVTHITDLSDEDVATMRKQFKPRRKVDMD